VRKDEIAKQKLFDMLNEYNEQMSKYKELQASGMHKDPVFEAILNARKEVITIILDILIK
jgi:hypothetical protein